MTYEGGFRYSGVHSNVQDARNALECAAANDIAIVCVGTGKPYESEASDRQTLRLPEVQERTILETAEQCKNTVVVVFAGGAIEMSAWADKVSSIVFAGQPGMGADEVLADLLTGILNFSGKLSETFPLKLEDTPSMQS